MFTSPRRKTLIPVPARPEDQKQERGSVVPVHDERADLTLAQVLEQARRATPGSQDALGPGGLGSPDEQWRDAVRNSSCPNEGPCHSRGTRCAGGPGAPRRSAGEGSSDRASRGQTRWRGQDRRLLPGPSRRSRTRLAGWGSATQHRFLGPALERGREERARLGDALRGSEVIDESHSRAGWTSAILEALPQDGLTLGRLTAREERLSETQPSGGSR